jgi:hypothetical protein
MGNTQADTLQPIRTLVGSSRTGSRLMAGTDKIFVYGKKITKLALSPIALQTVAMLMIPIIE